MSAIGAEPDMRHYLLAPEGFVITSAHRIASTDAQGAASLPAAG
jgi:hypothetical protein